MLRGVPLAKRALFLLQVRQVPVRAQTGYGRFIEDLRAQELGNILDLGGQKFVKRQELRSAEQGRTK